MTSHAFESINVTTYMGEDRPHEADDGRGVLWFDIDNCLYSATAGVSEMMVDKIRRYFESLGLTQSEAADLHIRYYKDFGLAVKGLVKFHNIDPLHYDEHCDAALPLEEVLHPWEPLQDMLSRIDRTKFKVWAITNAYWTHAGRVLRLLGLGKQFDGVVSCNYCADNFLSKPDADYFVAASVVAGQTDVSKNYFVDDSPLNVDSAYALGWGSCVLFDEAGDAHRRLSHTPDKRLRVINNILDLEGEWPEAFKKD